MGFRLDRYFLSGVLGLALWCAGPVNAQQPPPAGAGPEAPAPFDPSPIIGVPVEPDPGTPPASDAPVVRPEAASPQPADSVSPPSTPAAPQPTASAPAKPQPSAAAAPAHDPERPPAEPPAGSGDSGFAVRLGLGVGAALWISDGDLKLSKPVSLSLDLGYALDRRIAIIVRGSTWLRSGDLANEFLGAGAVYHFVMDRLYVAAVLGVSFTRDGAIDQWQHRMQGVALEIDVGQTFALSAHTEFAVGAHFQFGTPLAGKGVDAFTSIHAGVFLALGLR